jgi:cysteine-rich repeat protein
MVRASSICCAVFAGGCVVVACHSGEARLLLGVGGTGGNAPLVDAQVDAEGGPMVSDRPDTGVTDAGDAEAGAQPSNCGNGDLDVADGEECDDGNVQHSDGCENDCRTTRVAQVGIGEGFLCALSSGGGVKCWGRDQYGSLGRTTTSADITDPRSIPVLSFGKARHVVQIAVGDHHACALFEDGKARCWGRNDEGQLGIGSQLDYGDDPDEFPSALADLPLDNVKWISAGPHSTCAIAAPDGDDNLYCWGNNSRGELGIGSTRARTLPDLDRPTALFATPAEVKVGYHVACSLLSTAKARCWGGYDHGALGVGTVAFDIGDGQGDGAGIGEFPNSATYNVQGLSEDITDLSGSYLTFCAISQGSLFCWGRNDLGQAGYPVTHLGAAIWQTPRAVEMGNVALVQASVATDHGCVVDDRGVVRCWGSSVSGALGYPGIGLIGVDRDPAADYLRQHYGVREDAGVDYAAFSVADAGVALDGGMGYDDAGSGANDAGTAPVDAGTYPLKPGAVDLGDFDDEPGLDRVATVVAGHQSSCAIMETGTLRCWGNNEFGRLGYGPNLPEIGFSQTPAKAYREHGYADVPVFTTD